jgi:hypothetical protein
MIGLGDHNVQILLQMSYLQNSMKDLGHHGDIESLSLGMGYTKFKFQIQARSLLLTLRNRLVTV